jgi:crotonobetainyl-CoA:carnitine CoA-transferase CaiB-like acyl-CoA transferase
VNFRKLELLGLLDVQLIPAGPINEMHEVFSDSQVAARGLVIEQHLSKSRSPIRMIGNPIRFSRTPIAYRDAPPRLGAHTADILRDKLRIPEPELQRLIEEGIISRSNS